MAGKRNEKKRKGRRKTCLFICPIAEQGTDARRRTDAVLSKIVKPALNTKTMHYRVLRMDRDATPGNAIDALLTNLRKADLIIADITGLNPNVMYELGIRCAWNLPIIQIVATKSDEVDRTPLPFDLRNVITIMYGSPHSRKDCAKAQVAIRKQVHHWETGTAQSASFEAAFEKLARPIRTRAQFDTLRKVLQHALGDFDRSLQKIRQEADKEIAPASKKAVPDMLDLTVRPVDTLKEKWWILLEIARDLGIDPLEQFLKRMRNQIFDAWPKAATTLRKAKPSTQTFDSLKEILAGLADTAKSLAREIP